VFPVKNSSLTKCLVSSKRKHVFQSFHVGTRVIETTHWTLQNQKLGC